MAATNHEIERRFFTAPLEIRAKGDDGKMPKKVGGYAARFGSTYDMGWFTEEVVPGAFDGADMSDVVGLFNHDSNQILGRNTAGTLRLTIDSDGLGYEIDLPDSPNGHNVGVAVERGDITQSSWGFSIEEDEWRTVGGKDHRTIKKIKRVYDVSPVTFPANPDTTVAKRSRDSRPDDETEIFKLTRSRFLEVAGMVSNTQ